MKIIGKGFIANNLKKAKLNFKDNYVIYAAGISNSKTANKKELDREVNFFKKFQSKLNQSKIIIYISSFSVLDKTLKDDKYVKNKLIIENYLKKNSFKYLIIRLTQVVGYNKNPFTLTNFFFNNIKKGKNFTLWSNTRRNLIDINDVKLIFKRIVSQKFNKNQEINICNPISIKTKDIINILGRILKKKPKFNQLKFKKNSNYLYKSKIKNNKFSKYFRIKDYNEKLLKKYYK